MLFYNDIYKDWLENNVPMTAIIARLLSSLLIILNALAKSITAILVKGIDKKPSSKGYDYPNKKPKLITFVGKIYG